MEAELQALREEIAPEIEALPEPLRTVMRLRFMKGKSVQAVALETAYSADHAKVLIRKGKEALEHA